MAVVADLASTRVASSERAMVAHPGLGGIILFSRNYADRRQLRGLCAEIRDIAGRELVICVDQEGGRVQRFREDFTILPPAAAFGRIYDDNRDRARALCHSAGLTMARELLQCGVDLSFAPVADLDRGVCSVIGDRAFHRQPGAVLELCGSWIGGMHDAGMPAVAKHFAGHGAVAGDSHLEIPRDDRTLDEIGAEDLVPFAGLVDAGIEAVMTAHVRFPRVDDAIPTFSRFWIDEVLRRRLGFEGLVFSDDLSMQGAADFGGPVERAQAARDAGCDLLLVCNDAASALGVLDNLEGVDGSRALPLRSALPGGADEDRLDAIVAGAATELTRLAVT